MSATQTLAPPRRPHEPLPMSSTLEGLLQISNFVGSVMLLEDILDRIVTITGAMMRVPICSIYLLDEDQRLVMRSNIGFEPELKNNASFDMDEGIVGWVASTGEILALSDATHDPRHAPLPSALETGCRAYLCAPLRIQEQIIGVMTARKREAYHFTREDVILFETICKQVAIVIEKARMYEEKIQAERLAAVAVSLSGVAHYIKNVLLTMQGGEYLVDRGLSKDDLPQVRDGWDVLRRASGKIRKLVENILNYCRQSEPNSRPVFINDMLKDMAQVVGDSVCEKGVKVTAELDPQIGEVWIDAEIFYDAVLNLTINATEAIPEDQRGWVKVRTTKLEGRNQVLIEVIDSGTGIPAELQKKIFNLFFTTKGKKGTGIGLASARKTIEAHGGTIELAPSARGEGAHFMIYLPVTPPEAIVPAAAEED